MSTRREFLTYASLTALLTSLGKGALAADSGDQARAFSFDELIEQAQADALKPYRYPNTNADALLAKLDYAAHGQIRFKPELALFAKGPGQFPVTFFHLGSFFRTPVRVYAVDKGVAGHWRAQFDLTVDGKDPVELRLFLRLDGQPLSETWLYQYHPFHSDSTAIGVASTADNSDRP